MSPSKPRKAVPAKKTAKKAAKKAAASARLSAHATLVSDVGRLRTQVSALRGEVEAADAAPDRTKAIATWTAAQDRIRAALQQIDPVDLFAGLDAQVPLALLPVRLETRFADPGTDVLHVRIFPDDVHIDGHDDELTDTEAALGAALWAAPNDLPADGETTPAEPPAPDTSTGRTALWSQLVTLLGGPRAAWVAHATRPAPDGTAPTPTTKPQAYVRPPVARALPDRWLVRAYVGGSVVGEAWTSPVGVDLHLAPDPASVPDGAASTTAPAVDPQMQWLVDYPTAVSVGMAVDVPLTAGTQAVDRVVAVGVRASATAADSGTELSGLLTAHRYTDGFGVLPIGSPTANAPDARSAADRHADPIALWQQEFGAPAGTGSAAAQLQTALGLGAGVVDGSEGSGDTGDASARAMQTATWAATWGYYLGQLLEPTGLTPAGIDSVRTHYLDHVRGRGTVPTVRIGRQPYGVLPILPLGQWSTDGASPAVDRIAALLNQVRPLWQYGVGSPVTANEGPAFDAAFTAAMSTDAVARSYQIRTAMADRTFDPVLFTGIDPSPASGVVDAMIGPLLGLEVNPLILDLFHPQAQPVRAPLVVDPTDPTPDATVQAAIRNLAATNPHLVLLLPVWITPAPQSPATLLHTVLRRSLLLEYAAAGTSLLGFVTASATTLAQATRSEASTLPIQPPFNEPGRIPVRPPVVGPVADPPVSVTPVVVPPTAPPITATLNTTLPPGMLVGLTPDPSGGFTPVTTLPGLLSAPLPTVTGTLPTAEWLWRNPAQYVDQRRTLDETLAALGTLEGLTADELEILLPETLDLATHRWTAWAESVAADKLARMRASAATGVMLGGWGVVENVARRTRVAVDPSLSAGASAGPLWEDVRPGGFVHAPSTAQAATAAVLRAAHLAHGGEDDPTCAIDLSSARARVAVQLADGVRQGQPLGALLGYELELDLHERQADQLIAGLRAYAPAWKASGTFVEGDPETIVSPSAVCDGLALAGDDPAVVAAHVLPSGASTELATALAQALATLQDHQDALADLLTAEGVHQALAGNTARASGVLDAAHRGGLPPDDFDVLRTPRSGISLTCRLGVLLPPAAKTLAGGWPDSPRGQADPACATWLSGVLPELGRVRLRVADADGTITDTAVPVAAGIGPIDLVLDQPEVLQARLLLTLPGGSSLVDDRDPAWSPATVALPELLTVAADLREVLAGRALRQGDLLAAATPPAPGDERDTADLAARVAAARTALTGAASAVTSAGSQDDVAPMQAALVAAMSCGVVLQFPPAPASADLLAALGSASSELARRLAVPAPPDGADADTLIAALRSLLGSGQPALPLLALDPTTVTTAQAGLAAGDGFAGNDPELAEDWLADVAGVRAGAGRISAALQGLEALAADGLPDTWRILDPAPGAAWAATLSADILATTGPATTVVLRTGARTGIATGVSGFVVDEWVEVVPQAIAATSVAYQAEAPTARAPQAVLLGIAPNLTQGWTVESVVDLALEALSWSQLRTVDAEHAAWLGRMLPAVVLPDGDATDVIAAPPLPLMQIDATVLDAARLKVKELG